LNAVGDVYETDVDECNGMNDCPSDTVCVNTYGTYFCVSSVKLGHSYIV